MGAFLLFGGWYVLSARHWFKGPVRQGSEEELARIEAGFEAPAAPATSPAGQGVVTRSNGGRVARPPSA